MTLKCSLCPSVFTSLLVNENEVSLAKISSDFITHFQKSHSKETKELVEKLTFITGILPWMLFMNMAMWEDETYINTERNKWTEKILESLGITLTKEANLE